MTRIADTLIDQMVKAVVDEVDPEQVILFGSRARGEEQEDWDVDLVVVEAEPFGRERSRHKEMVRLYKVLANFPVSADILVYTHGEVDYWRDSLNHVLRGRCGKGRSSMSDPKCAPDAARCGRTRC